MVIVNIMKGKKMKIRTGFVSNSSSSSFICDVCGEIESGMDAGLSDFEMAQCINGHIFHIEESNYDEEKLTLEDAIPMIEDAYGKDSELIKKMKDAGDDWHDILDEEGESYLLKDGIPERFCPICRFEKIADSEFVKYLIKSTGKTKEELLKEVKEKFGDYKEFKQFIEEEKK